jgi:hypothetical protein
MKQTTSDSGASLSWERNFGSMTTGAFTAAYATTDGVILGGCYYNAIDIDTYHFVSNGGYDILLMKLDNNGAIVWAKSFGSPYGADWAGDETILDVSVDSQNNILVAGSFYDTMSITNGLHSVTLTSASQKDPFIAKFSAQGDILYAKSFGSPGGDDAAMSLAIDSSDNFAVVGRFYNSLTLSGTQLNGLFLDAFVAKLSGDGTLLWAKNFGGPRLGNAIEVAIDKQNNIIIGGTFGGTVTINGVTKTSVGSDDVFFTKLNAQGEPVFTRFFGSVNADTPTSVVTDSANAYYLSVLGGVAMNFGLGPIGVTPKHQNVVKVSSSGATLWNIAFEKATSGTIDVSVDGLLSAGSFSGPGVFGDVTLPATGTQMYIAQVQP